MGLGPARFLPRSEVLSRSHPEGLAIVMSLADAGIDTCEAFWGPTVEHFF